MVSGALTRRGLVTIAKNSLSERIKLYLDEDTQRTDLIQALHARHVDVETTSEAKLLGQPDEVHLKYAADQRRVIFTFKIQSPERSVFRGFFISTRFCGYMAFIISLIRIDRNIGVK